MAYGLHFLSEPMDNQTKKGLRGIVSFLLMASALPLLAVPNLQLDIPGGTYDTVDETIVATSSDFTLRALLKDTSDLSQLHYLSIAIVPGVEESVSAPDIGSFDFDGTTYTGSSLNWGIPPLNVPDPESGDLAPHGVYPTYFTEVSFLFSSALTVPSYNTQTGDPATGDLYYKDFLVDASGLLAGYNLHFDLYNQTVKDDGEYTVDDFAPFSHDAASETNVPDENITVILLGLAALAITGVRRRLNCG
jgi:hypothetical protein